jgi:3-methyladenine DNA glycosylase AlkD
LRKVAQAFAPLPLKDIERLLHHPRHEMRMCALLLLLVQTKKCPVSDEIIKLYLRNTAYINNWDLVDLSAPALVGRYYFDKGENADLCSLANSSLLRERRIAIIATFYFIRHGQHTLTFSLAKMLLHDPEELIHKAVGRMLREV